MITANRLGWTYVEPGRMLDGKRNAIEGGFWLEKPPGRLSGRPRGIQQGCLQRREWQHLLNPVAEYRFLEVPHRTEHEMVEVGTEHELTVRDGVYSRLKASG